MEDHYGIADLNNYINNGRSIFHPIPLVVPDLLSGGHHSSFTVTPTHQNYSAMTQLVDRQETEMVPGGGLNPDSNITCGLYSNGGWEMEAGGSGRWPRQETLTLLEIRSRLDSKFKESIHKGPLWDEVSRIMSEEHGYQRTGKKCREKFDNLYKYYKKTKDGKSGRQDGKNYRFFRQLEALYGDSKSAAASFSGIPLSGTSFPYGASFNAVVSNIQESLQPSKLSAESISMSKSSGFYSEKSDLNTMLDDDSSHEKGKKKKSKKKWKAKVKDFIDSEMRDLMEKQDDWLERVTRMIEEKEQERLVREEEWRKQEEARIEREEKFWATQRCWIEARNSSMMETMRILSSKDVIIENDLPSRSTIKDFNCVPSFHVTRSDDDEILQARNSWMECEITSLIQLRTSMEPRFHRIIECPEEVLWEEIAAKMAYSGYDRNALMCKDKWESISKYFMKGSMNIKRKDQDSRSCFFIGNESINNEMGMGNGLYSCSSGNGHGNIGTGKEAQSDHHDHDGCYRYMLGAADQSLWFQ